MTCIYGMQFNNLGLNNASYLVNSSFNDGFGCAIGIQGTSSTLFQNNVIFHATREPIAIFGDSNIFRYNLLVAADKLSNSKFLGDSIVAENNFLAGTNFAFKVLFLKCM